ncbi:MAG TPA: hypothetical protein VMP68_16435 [Candidatus Eisenbacteria bacterium]|nr:hypothetical protein [Candidatus Eisenbacteria bacterium]
MATPKMKAFGFAVIVIAAVLALQAAPSPNRSAPSATLYDNFSQSLINDALWTTYCSSTTRSEECVIDIESGKLRVARRISGLRTSNTGYQWSGAGANFANPLAIKSITADVTVRNIVEKSCAANPELGGNASIFGMFFNDGSGNPNNNLGASLVLGHISTDPKSQIDVLGQMSLGYTPLQTIGIGTVTMGTPITATVQWDQPNHQFVLSWTNDVTHQTTSGNIPYTYSDTMPAVNPNNTVSVNVFPANCTASDTWVAVDSTFDNVYISQ